jgi:sugar lactone lactonase YvrE
VSTVATELGDPGGIVLDGDGALYIAETAHHRILRMSAGRR